MCFLFSIPSLSKRDSWLREHDGYLISKKLSMQQSHEISSRLAPIYCTWSVYKSEVWTFRKYNLEKERFLISCLGCDERCHETIKHLENIAFLLVVFECHIFKVSRIHKKPAVPNFHIAVF